MDIDGYLVSADALHQTKSVCGTLLHPGQSFDGFRVLSFLGHGATSEVWRVRDLRQDRDYALKIFAPPADDPTRARQRFLTEARALDEFRHPNLMRRYAFKEDGNHPYFTMDVLHPLPERLTECAIIQLLDGILAGLNALHAKGIVHRDLKPSNILLDDAGNAVLADLGVAHVAAPDLAKRLGDTQTPDPTLADGSPFVGTPRYAAPEQFAGEDVTPATDFHALGIVLEELLGGSVPRRWRPLLKRLTEARPRFRIRSAREVRRHLRLIRLRPFLTGALAAIVLVTASGLLWNGLRPNWIVLSDLSADIITLDGGHYIQPSLRFQPMAELGPDNVVTLTNPVDRVFDRMFTPKLNRRPIHIQGTGTLKCPEVVGCEVHIGSGITFITSGRFKPDGALITSPVPPSDACWTNHVGYPSFVVGKGATLVFTDNAAYPPALIRRE